MDEVVGFLRDHEPFNELDEGALERLAARIDVESFPGGEINELVYH